MAAAKRIDDPVFGTLKWDDFEWTGRIDEDEGVAKPVELRVESDDEDEPPTAAQRAAYKALRQDSRGLWGVLEEAMWAYYQKFVIPVYRRQLGPRDAALDTPELKEPGEVWRLVSGLTITVPTSQKRPTVEFTGRCEWDDEHGFEMTLRDGQYAGRG